MTDEHSTGTVDRNGSKVEFMFKDYQDFKDNSKYVQRQTYIKLAREAYWEQLSSEDKANPSENDADKNYFSRYSSQTRLDKDK